MNAITNAIIILSCVAFTTAHAEVTITGNVKDPKNLQHQEGVTLGKAIKDCGGLNVFAHILVVFRQTDDVNWVYTFDFRTFRSKAVQSFRLNDGDKIHVTGKQLYRGRPTIPSTFQDLIQKSNLDCIRVDYARLTLPKGEQGRAHQSTTRPESKISDDSNP
ncbi:MAG: SLBB domain-containing protein [Akkermansiaceae bacterium]|nr:SLBB domain-containing protein [Akkermansiaceae bacterium]